jgi:predicted PurR-regulated permease PerM
VGQVAERAAEQAAEQAAEVAVEQAAEQAVEQAAERAAEQAAEAARDAEAGALEARDEAEQARHDAVDAGGAAVAAASVVAPDDPLLDTAVRKIEAQATPERPFGVPGRPTNPRSPFRVAFTAALGVAVAYGLVQAVIAVRSVLVLLLTAGFLAIGLNPAVEAMERRGMRRSLAVAVVLVTVLLLFAGFFLAVVPPIIDQAQQFASKAPHYLTQLQGNRQVAALDGRFHFLGRARAFLDRPDQLGGSVSGGIFGVGKVVFSAFVSALTVLILTLYFLANLPAIKAQAYRLVPRSRRARFGLLTDEILSRTGGYVAGALSIAAIAGSSTFVVLAVTGVPYPVALAIVVAVTDLIPLVGATIGAVAVTGVALFVSLRTGIIVGGYYLAYQQFENYVIYPRVMQRSVDVSPAATVVAVLVGGALLGVLGALLAIPITAAVQLVLHEVLAPRQDTL